MTVAVTGVTLDRSTATIALGSAGTTLVATVAPATATNKSLTWSSSDTAVATVNAAGVVVPVTVGTTTITATTVDGAKTASCTVTVAPVSVTGVSLDMATLTFILGGASSTLVATVSPANATNAAVTWASSDTTVATVSGTGVVAPVGLGTATITVTTTDGSFTATVAVTVSPVAVSGVTLNTATLPLLPAATGQLTATIAPANATNQAVTWSTSAAGVATVSATGLVTAVSVGDATITVSTVDGSFTATALVQVRQPATGVSLNYTTHDLYIGGATVTLVATVTPAAASQVVTWASNHPEIATVSSAGVVTAVALGDATITATTVGGAHSATCVVSVIPTPVSGVMLNAPTLSKAVGDTSSTLVASVIPPTATNTNVTWSSSDTDVATVNESGAVSAVASGTSTITVTTEDGAFTATSVVTVSPDGVTTVSSTAPRTGQIIVSWAAATDAHATGVEVTMTNDGGGTNLPAQTVPVGTTSVVLSGLSFPAGYTISLRTLGAASTTSSPVTHVAATVQVVHILSNSYQEGPRRMVLIDTNGSGNAETHDTVIARSDEALPRNYRWVLWPGLAAPSDPATVSFENQRYDTGTSTWVSTGRFAFVSNAGKPNNDQWYSWANPDPNTNTVYTAPDAGTPEFRGTATFVVEPGMASGSVRFRQYSDTARALLHTYYHGQAQTAAAVGARFDADSTWFLEPLTFTTP